VLLHARQGHVELLGKLRDRSVCTPELLQNAASCGVLGLAACKGTSSSALRSSGDDSTRAGAANPPSASCVQARMGRTLALFSLLLAACTMDEPDPPVPPAASARTSPRSSAPAPPPAPAATPTRRRHSVSRAPLPTGEKLPRRGIVLHSWGLGSESIVTVDAATLHIWENVVGSMDRGADRLYRVAYAARGNVDGDDL